MLTTVRNIVGMILVALSCFMYGIKVDSGWYYNWLAPLTFAIVGFFAIVSNAFLKTFLHFLAVCLGLVLVLWLVLVHQYDSGIEFFIMVIPILSAKSSLFLVIFISARAVWNRFQGRAS